METTSIGTPMSRRTSLSRSNIRLAEEASWCPYPSDSLLRIWSNVSGVRDSSSRATRFTRRSSGCMAAASYFPPCRQTSRGCVCVTRPSGASGASARACSSSTWTWRSRRSDRARYAGRAGAGGGVHRARGAGGTGDRVLVNTTAVALGLGTGGSTSWWRCPTRPRPSSVIRADREGAVHAVAGGGPERGGDRSRRARAFGRPGRATGRVRAPALDDRSDRRRGTRGRRRARSPT